MPLLDGPDLLESLRRAGEAFLQRLFGKARVQSGPLVPLARRSGFQLDQGIPLNSCGVACCDGDLSPLRSL